MLGHVSLNPPTPQHDVFIVHVDMGMDVLWTPQKRSFQILQPIVNGM